MLKGGELQKLHFRSRCYQQWMKTYNFKPHAEAILLDISIRWEGDFVVIPRELPGFEREIFEMYNVCRPKLIQNELYAHHADACHVVNQFKVSFFALSCTDVVLCTDESFWRNTLTEENYSIHRCNPRDLSSRTQIALSFAIGIPIICFDHIYKHNTRGIIGRTLGIYTLLALVYETIVDLYPYDVEQQTKLVILVNEVYDRSIASFDNAHLKVDYELVVLRNYQEFRRIQETSNVHSKSLYWFDNSHTKTVDAKGVMDLLAIERSWAKDPTSNVRYLVTCGFPAGTMFLKTTVEAQATTRGGGIEYLHLDTGLGYTFINSVQINIDK